MNDVIRADYPTLAQVSQRLVAQAEALVDMQQVVVRIEKKLQTGGWIGLGSEAFVDEMAGEVLPALQRLIDALRQAGASTQAMAKLIGDAEEAAASPFREETALSSRLASADGGTGAPSGGGQEPNAGTDNAGDGISDQSSSHPNGGSNPDQSATTAEGSIGPDIGVMTPDDGGGSDIGGGTGPGGTIGEGSSAGDSGRAGDLGIPGEWGIPGDWLDGIRDYGGMLPGQSEWGIPYDWLDGVYAAIETGPEAEFIDPLAEATEESSGGGGGGGGSVSRVLRGGLAVRGGRDDASRVTVVIKRDHVTQRIGFSANGRRLTGDRHRQHTSLLLRFAKE
ncbi:MAG: WXG100 family type VII secretion target [Caldilineaceae bacterium]|nr:WXG100 family type VII secretion target [Caldilineaceae bacterium]